MPSTFDLFVTTHDHTAEFALHDANGNQLAWHNADFAALPAGRWRSLFDLGGYLDLYVEPDNEEAEIAAVGVCIAETVLGADIFLHLWQPATPRTLRLVLPGAADGNSLAALLANIPWETARPSADKSTLAERNLLLRIVYTAEAPAAQPLALSANEPLRVLYVFAEARGSTPLGARRERLSMAALFRDEIYPQRQVTADFLTHGVTRERLLEQITEQGGYHAVHWSGHGNLNLLELARSDGKQDTLSGEDLLALFNDAGVCLPRLFFLSACHSGHAEIHDWEDFRAVAAGRTPGRKHGEASRDLNIPEAPGFTGTAHALLQGGVPSVVAMRYAVGDDYARELAVAFYRALLADAQPKNAAAALNQARKALLRDTESGHFSYCDHATPLLYGAEQPGLILALGKSPAAESRNPCLTPIAELSSMEHHHFVGRTWELSGLGAGFIGTRKSGATVKPVALVTGLGGMGKTALAAEALALWQARFDWALLYQAKPNPLAFDATLRDIHVKLMSELGRYHDHVTAHRGDAIHREANAEIGFTGETRRKTLIRNLVRAMQDEAILLVLDNFETHLKPDPQAGSNPPAWACQDDAWDQLLTTLARDLAGSSSRVLVTSRRPLTALIAAHPVPLGPLPAAEAALYLRDHPALDALLFSTDADEQTLAYRLLYASRFHPLLMDRLARLVEAGLRDELQQALTTLESSKDYSHLPELFACGRGDNNELTYLDDALKTSLDQLIAHAGADARRLLWMIALANEPVALGLLKGVWSGEDFETQQFRQMKQMLEMAHLLTPEAQEKLKAFAMPEVQALLDALPPASPHPDPDPLLNHLTSVGLVTLEPGAPDNPDLTCHELVRERIFAWMADHPEDQAAWNAAAIRLAYAERLEAVFQALQHQDMSTALQAGSRALVYCVQAQAWERLGGFAGSIVTGTGDPRLLGGLLPHLHSAAESAPEGRPRWSCLGYLADALARGGRPDASLAFYELAAALSLAAAQVGGSMAQQAWSDYAAITGNWANALGDAGKLDAARQRQLDSAAAAQQAGRPAIQVIGRELEALRIDIKQGQVETALPEVEKRLTQVAAWWERQQAGERVAEAPDPEFLARVYIGALDIATDADFAREDWTAALGHIDASLAVKRALQRPEQEIATTRMNRANVLVEFPERYGEAQAELEACLALFQDKPDWAAKVLGSLADLFAHQGDLAQAIAQQRRALAICETLPDPADRAISHNNLANYLERRGTPADVSDSTRHRLAALVYHLVAGLGQHLQTSLHNYAIRYAQAHQSGSELSVPRIADLLAEPAFAPLREWLAQRQVDGGELQQAVDHLLAQAHQAALAAPAA